MQYWLEQALIDLVLGLIWSVPMLLLIKQRNVIWWKIVSFLRRLHNSSNHRFLKFLAEIPLFIVSRLRPYNADSKRIEYCLGQIYFLSTLVYGYDHHHTRYAMKQLDEYHSALSSVGEKKVFRWDKSHWDDGDMWE